MNRTALLVAALVLGCGSRDECAQLKAKVRPLIEGMAHEANKPIDDAKLDELAAEFCAEPSSDSERTLRKCLLDARDQPAAAACLEVEFKAYADDGAAIRAKSDARLAKLRAEREELDRQLTATRAALPDAAPADAAIDARPAVDVATLPEWPIPPHVAPAGPATEVYAIDENADRLLVQLAGKGPLLVAAANRKISGKVVAPSQAQAFAALAAQVEITPAAPRFAGSGPTVDLAFGGAPQRDLFALLGDTMRVTIVAAGGDAPDLDVVVRRVPAGAVLNAVVALDGRVTKQVGNVIYVLAKGAKLPPLPKLAGGALELDAVDATPGQIAAALGRIAKLPGDLCGGDKVARLHLHKVPLAEAARAIAVATGATWSAPGSCPAVVSEVATLAATARLVVTARLGTAAIAVVDAGLVATGKVSPGVVELGGTVLRFPSTWQPPPDRFDAWLAQVKRTSSVVRSGTAWSARLDDGSLIEEHRNTIPDLFGVSIAIGPGGVTLPAQGPLRAPLTIPLAR